MQFTMVIEQTKQYAKRMQYHPETNTFTESDYESLMSARQFLQPYGWIKESGTPPDPHWDVILMTGSEEPYQLGDEVKIKIIGIFMRRDGDHKFIAVERTREIEDYSQLREREKADLNRLYPHMKDGEGWFGKEKAEKILSECTRI